MMALVDRTRLAKDSGRKNENVGLKDCYGGYFSGRGNRKSFLSNLQCGVTGKSIGGLRQ